MVDPPRGGSSRAGLQRSRVTPGGLIPIPSDIVAPPPDMPGPRTGDQHRGHHDGPPGRRAGGEGRRPAGAQTGGGRRRRCGYPGSRRGHADGAVPPLPARSCRPMARRRRPLAWPDGAEAWRGGGRPFNGVLPASLTCARPACPAGRRPGQAGRNQPGSHEWAFWCPTHPVPATWCRDRGRPGLAVEWFAAFTGRRRRTGRPTRHGTKHRKPRRAA